MSTLTTPKVVYSIQYTLYTYLGQNVQKTETLVSGLLRATLLHCIGIESLCGSVHTYVHLLCSHVAPQLLHTTFRCTVYVCVFIYDSGP